jgi:hypothetical protein
MIIVLFFLSSVLIYHVLRNHKILKLRVITFEDQRLSRGVLITLAIYEYAGDRLAFVDIGGRDLD